MANRVKIDQFGTWGKIVKKAFHGNQRVQAGRPKIVGADGVPDFAAKVGTLCYVPSTGNCYICTVASGTWVLINA